MAGVPEPGLVFTRLCLADILAAGKLGDHFKYLGDAQGLSLLVVSGSRKKKAPSPFSAPSRIAF